MKGQYIRRAWEYFSLYCKLPATFLAICLVFVTYYYWHGYRTSTYLLIDRRLELCVKTMENLLPADYHDRITGANSIPAGELDAIQARLDLIARHENLSFIYAFMRVDGVMRTTASNREPFFAPYDDNEWLSLQMTEADGRTRFDDGEDDFGQSRSIIVRRVSPGGRPYFLGADIELRDINDIRRAQRTRHLWVGVVFFAAVGAASFVLARIITRPLKRLSDFAEAIRLQGFADAPSVDADLLPLSSRASDEVPLLAQNIKLMQDELSVYLRRLTLTVAARERAESEMRIAGDIQQSLLASAPPESPVFSAWGAMTPAKSAGGDFFDYFRLDDRRIAFAIGDVSGKGVSAAIFMASGLTLFRACANHLGPALVSDSLASGIMRRTDRMLSKHNPSMQFVTAVMGILDEEDGRVCLANGGHNPPLLARPGGTAEFLPLPVGCLLGVGLGEAEKFGAVCFTLAPGETLVLYTDGVTEAIAADDSFFGDERLRKVAAAAAGLPPQAMVDAIMGAVRDFCAGCDLADDVTVLAIRRDAGPGDSGSALPD